MVPVTDLVGSELVSVTASWLVERGERVAPPVHVWLEFVPAGMVQVVTANSGRVELAREEPYAGYSLGGEDRVAIGTDEQILPVERFVGDTVRSVSRLVDADGEREVGVLLEFEAGAVGFASVGDELVVGLWPELGWAELGICSAS